MNTRILKFRYFDPESKSFVHSDDFNCPTNLQRLTLFFEKTQVCSDGKIQQFTGLTDKNGREIYEGDILRLNDKPHFSLSKVLFEDGCFMISGFEGICGNQPLWDWKNENSEVIGNIFQNPSLLSEKAS